MVRYFLLFMAIYPPKKPELKNQLKALETKFQNFTKPNFHGDALPCFIHDGDHITNSQTGKFALCCCILSGEKNLSAKVNKRWIIDGYDDFIKTKYISNWQNNFYGFGVYFVK